MTSSNSIPTSRKRDCTALLNNFSLAAIDGSHWLTWHGTDGSTTADLSTSIRGFGQSDAVAALSLVVTCSDRKMRYEVAKVVARSMQLLSCVCLPRPWLSPRW